MYKKEVNQFTRKVFLSYDFNSSDKINLVKLKLKEIGFDVITHFDLVNCDNIIESFNNQINKCDCAVFVVTKKNSEKFIKEWDIASGRGITTFVYIKKEVFAEDIKTRLGNTEIVLWNDEDDLANCIIEEMSRYVYRYSNRAYQFECIVNEIFKYFGWQTRLATKNDKYDILAQKEGMKLYIEAKSVRQRMINKSTIASALVSSLIFADMPDSKFVLVVANELPVSIQEFLKQNNDVVVVDIGNLLYIAEHNERLKSQLLSILEYSVEDILPKKPTELMNIMGVTNDGAKGTVYIEENSNDNKTIQDLIIELENWEPMTRKSTEYEDLCTTVLKKLFEDDLGKWIEQQKSNEDLYRFDLICNIKEDVQEAFWKFIEVYFRSKYIIFEFKNYSDTITQKEVYTTEKYLYAKALRCVAILVSCYGEDRNAKKAIKGSLRENGKLIISISNKDLIAMLNCKLKGASPAAYLYNKIDAMLIELDK